MNPDKQAEFFITLIRGTKHDNTHPVNVYIRKKNPDPPVKTAEELRTEIQEWFRYSGISGELFADFLADLSLLAFCCRRDGGKSAYPAAGNLLLKYELCAARITPLFVMNREGLLFMDQSIEDYLCAGALIRSPELLYTVKNCSILQFGMVISYACEIKFPLPEILWRTAWNMDPFIGIAVTDMSRTNRIMRDDSYNPLRTFARNTTQNVPEVSKAELRKMLQIVIHILKKRFDMQARHKLMSHKDFSRFYQNLFRSDDGQE